MPMRLSMRENIFRILDIFALDRITRRAVQVGSWEATPHPGKGCEGLVRGQLSFRRAVAKKGLSQKDQSRGAFKRASHRAYGLYMLTDDIFTLNCWLLVVVRSSLFCEKIQLEAGDCLLFL